MKSQQFEFCRLAARGTMSSTECARRAGYKNPAVTACRLIKLKHIQERISLLRQNYLKDQGVEVSDLLDDLLAIAQQPSIGTYLTQLPESGEVIFKDLSELSPEQLTAVKSSVPVKDILGEWHCYTLHDRAVAIAELIKLLNPILSKLQCKIITNALCRIGTKRGLNEVELAILEGRLTN